MIRFPIFEDGQSGDWKKELAKLKRSIRKVSRTWLQEALTRTRNF